MLLVLPAVAVASQSNSIKASLKAEIRHVDTAAFPEIHLQARLKDPFGRTVPILKTEQLYLWESLAQAEKDIKEPELEFAQDKEKILKNHRLGVVFLVDTKKNMSAYLPFIRGMLQTYLGLMHPQDHFVLSTSHQGRPFELLQAVTEVKKLSDPQITSLLKRLQTDKQPATQQLFEGLKGAIEQASQFNAAHKVVVVFSDALGQRFSPLIQTLQQRAHSAQIRVLVIGLGHPYWHQELANIAKKSDGQYLPLTPRHRPEELAQLQYLHAINTASLRQMQTITYDSPFSLAWGEHIIRLRIQFDSQHFTENQQSYYTEASVQTDRLLLIIAVVGGICLLSALTFVLYKRRTRPLQAASYLSPLMPLGYSPQSEFQGKLMSEGQVKTFEPSQTLLIGRSKHCDFYLQDPLVSTKHAQIRWKDNMCLIEDLDSSNGTFVNGQRISQHILNNGDQIRVGDTHLRFEYNQDKGLSHKHV